MRFPDVMFMKRTFDLARNRLGLADKMLQFRQANENAYLSYNGITVTRKKNDTTPSSADIFKVSVTNGGNIPDKYVAEGTEAFLGTALRPLRDLFVKYPISEALKELGKFDCHSVMSYLLGKGYPYHVTKWFETMESRTGGFDTALTESVLGSLIFSDPLDREIDWFYFVCVNLVAV